MPEKRPRRAKRRAPRASGLRPESPSGPLTLAEARALAAARSRRPARARAFAREAAAPTPGTVGEARTELAARRRTQTQQRVDDYRATMRLLQQRGVRGLAEQPPAGRRRAFGVAAPSGPLRILAEGDSWFDYPVPFFGGGIIERLEKRVGVPILSLAKAGDEVRYMLGVEERKQLIKHLKRGSPAGGPWDVLLFSGGGNDIVDNPMALWIREFDPAISPAAHLHPARFAAALALVRAGYEDLIALRDALSPGTQLVFHAYDFAIPDGRGICHLGPWLRPTFELRNFSDAGAAFEVVKAMLQQFAAMLQSLTAAGGVTFINGQGTLAATKASWHNELHPSRAGYDKFAALFHQTLKALFPARVL